MSKELRVEIGSDAYASCFCHALSTEHEEIMGLLIGTFGGSTKSSDEVICKIFMSMVLIRSDKRKDRVEIPIETMAGVSAKVDEIGKKTGIPNLQVKRGGEGRGRRRILPTAVYFCRNFQKNHMNLPFFVSFQKNSYK